MRRLLQHPRVRKHLNQGSRFVVVGGIGACIDLGGAAFFVNVLSFSPYLATACSTLCAVTMVFLGNKFFTFRNREAKTGMQALKFATVYGVAILANLATTWILIHFGVHYLTAKVIAIGFGVVWNYSMSHLFVFKRNEL